jgi:hypothetical protein
MNEELQNIFERLPKKIKEVLMSQETNSRIQAIANDNGLRIDKVETLIFETTKLIAGLIPRDLFKKRLQQQLDISSVDASALVKDIDSRLLVGIRESIIEQPEAGDERFSEANYAGTNDDTDEKENPSKETAPKQSNEVDIDLDEYIGGGNYQNNQFDSQDSAVSGNVYNFNSGTTENEKKIKATSDNGTERSQEIDPNKSFKDILQEKMKDQGKDGQKDPYRESIE